MKKILTLAAAALLALSAAAEKYSDALLQRAQRGDALAQYELATAYMEGNGVEKNLLKGFNFYLKAANNDYYQVWRQVGHCYENSIGVTRDYARAAEAYHKEVYYLGSEAKPNMQEFIGRMEKLADTDGDAARALSMCYANGWGVSKDATKQFQYALKGAQAGDPQSMAIAGDCYQTGHGTTVNYPLALELLKKAADAGFTPANFSLGVMYQEGRGVAKSIPEAVRYYGRAARMRNLNALNNLGSIYWNEKGEYRNPFRAIECFEKAAGDRTAEGNLRIVAENLVRRQRDDRDRVGAGVMLIGGKEYDKGLKLLNKAAAKEPMALGVLACVYGNESYGMPNLVKAVDYARQGAAKYDMLSIATLGTMYYNGMGVPVDYYKAAEYWSQASSLGDVESTYNLGILYLNGKGVEANPSKARELLTKAVEEGLPDALVALGVMSYKGEGVPRDYDLAYRLLKICSENGKLFSKEVYAEITRDLSACYRFGRGTAQDEVLADYWLEIANEYGSEDAAGMQVKFDPIAGSII